MWDLGYDYPVLKLIKNADLDKYKYLGFGIAFDRCGTFSVPGGSGRIITRFGIDISSSTHVYNKKKDILIFCKGPRQGLDNTTLTAAFNQFH